jgi:hypothetical protein
MVTTGNSPGAVLVMLMKLNSKSSAASWAKMAWASTMDCGGWQPAQPLLSD